jgi:hypothetical protein
MRPVVARVELALPRERIYERLADLRRHWALAGRWVAPLAVHDDGAVVRLRGPLGVRRTARTSLDARVVPSRIAGTARVGATVAEISWTLDAIGPCSTAVTLRADLARTAAIDRLVLALGGRRWLRARFAATLRALAREAGGPERDPAVSGPEPRACARPSAGP